MRNEDALFRAAVIVFYLMALVVIWNMLAPPDMRLLSEIGRKIWAMAGVLLYFVILLEKRRRRDGR